MQEAQLRLAGLSHPRPKGGELALTKLTLRGLAMTSVAYITAITIGIFAVTVTSSTAAMKDLSTDQAQRVTELTQSMDPLNKFRGVKTLTQYQLVELLSAVGFKGSALKTAWAVAMRESHGHPTSHNQNASTGDNSYGLFQINMLGSLGIDRREKFNIANNAELLDPVTNAQAAYYMTNGGSDWGSWGLGPNAYDGSAAEPAVTKFLAEFPKS